MVNANVKPISPAVIQEAVQILKNGGLVITPTRTNYNLICDPTHEEAVAKVFEVKKRTKFGPLTLALSFAEQAAPYVKYPDFFDPAVLNELWPGELTVIFEKEYPFPANLTMGAPTLATAYQGPSVLHDIIAAYEAPVACTSANLSGQGDIFVDLEKAVLDIGDKVELVIDAGQQSAAASLDVSNKSNTIIDLTFDVPHLVREGVVPVARLQALIPNLNIDTDAYKAKLQARIQG
jgi:L-threonylcarbamoyladenylate synthase